MQALLAQKRQLHFSYKNRLHVIMYFQVSYFIYSSQLLRRSYFNSFTKCSMAFQFKYDVPTPQFMSSYFYFRTEICTLWSR